jgi:hypothetical protein
MSTPLDAMGLKDRPSYIHSARSSAELMKDDLARRDGDPLLANAIEIIESLANLLEVYETNPVAAQSLVNQAKERRDTPRRALEAGCLCEL